MSARTVGSVLWLGRYGAAFCRSCARPFPPIDPLLRARRTYGCGRGRRVIVLIVVALLVAVMISIVIENRGWEF